MGENVSQSALYEALPGGRAFTLPTIVDARGALTYAEVPAQVPFAVKRIFMLHDLPDGAARGAHAHRAQHQFLICLGGSCRIGLDDGVTRAHCELTRPSIGLHVRPMTWVTVDSMSPHASLLVLVSDRYDEGDYVRDYDEFTRLHLSRERLS